MSQNAVESLSFLPDGVFYGICTLEALGESFPMVMSYGNNDFYKNESKSAEVHIYDRLFDDFYGSRIDIEIQGYIREQRDFSNVEALITEIKNDIEIAKEHLRLCQVANSHPQNP